VCVRVYTHTHTHTHTLSTGGLVTLGRDNPARRWLALKSINCAAARMHSIVATLSTLLPPAPEEAIATASTCVRRSTAIMVKSLGVEGLVFRV